MKIIKNFIKVPHLKNAAEADTLPPLIPDRLVISMSQHIGAPCIPLVKAGDTVVPGQKIGDIDAFVSAPVHTGLGGKVKEITEITNIAGRRAKAVVIEVDINMPVPESTPPVIENGKQFLDAVRASGAVGLGGAGFPTHVKLHFDSSINNAVTNPEIDTLIVNGAECEPYITSDYRAFIEDTDGIIAGINHVVKWNKIKNVVIGIEDNKPKAIAAMRARIKDINAGSVTVTELPSKYPQGAEKVLIYNVTGKIVAPGKLPSSAGCCVANPSTLFAVANYISTGRAVVKRRVTIDGDLVNKPCNRWVYVGTPLEFILKNTELRKQPDRIIFGGPMMGGAARYTDMPFSKTNNSVLFMSGKLPAPSPCIRCGRCVRACSMNLLPVKINLAYENKDYDTLKQLKTNLCMNCGACTYVCPAQRHVSETNQLAKLLVI